MVDLENAMVMEEAPRPCIVVPENPKEHPNLNGGEVIPIDTHKQHRAPGLLEHYVDCTDAEFFLGAPP
jgi:hypothetical protein